jgi:GT2 family glycosyltransferase
MSIAIVIPAYNRLHLLRQCVENVVLKTSELTREILIWDNASDEETASYLDSLDDRRIRVIHSSENLGQNTYAHAFPLTTSEFLVQVDDDVIDAPVNWDASLLDGFRRLPDIGYLATNLVDDGHSLAAEILHRRDRHLYNRREVDGVRILDGPTGGWCAMTSRAIHDEVGGYPENRDFVFWLADEAYIKQIRRRGYKVAILEDVEVFHANGPYYSDEFPEKKRFWSAYHAAEERKETIKRRLLCIPLMRQLNERYGFFVAPAERD